MDHWIVLFAILQSSSSLILDDDPKFELQHLLFEENMNYMRRE